MVFFHHIDCPVSWGFNHCPRRQKSSHSDETFKNTQCRKPKQMQMQLASSYASHLRTHLKTHRGGKSHECNQCDYASSRADRHSREKSFICNLCGYTSSQASHLRRRLIIHHCKRANMGLIFFKYQNSFTPEKAFKHLEASN